MEGGRSGKKDNALNHVDKDNSHAAEHVRTRNPLMAEMDVLETIKKQRIVIQNVVS